VFDGVVARPLALSCAGTAAYTLDANAAASLLNALERATHASPWPLDLSTLDAHALVPALVTRSRDPDEPSRSPTDRDAWPTRHDRARHFSPARLRRRLVEALSERIS